MTIQKVNLMISLSSSILILIHVILTPVIYIYFTFIQMHAIQTKEGQSIFIQMLCIAIQCKNVLM